MLFIDNIGIDFDGYLGHPEIHIIESIRENTECQESNCLSYSRACLINSLQPVLPVTFLLFLKQSSLGFYDATLPGFPKTFLTYFITHFVESSSFSSFFKYWWTSGFLRGFIFPRPPNSSIAVYKFNTLMTPRSFFKGQASYMSSKHLYPIAYWSVPLGCPISIPNS